VAFKNLLKSGKKEKVTRLVGIFKKGGGKVATA